MIADQSPLAVENGERVELLSEAECIRLLASTNVGRVAMTQHALPVVLPVNFALDGHGVVIRTAPGSLLAAAHNDVVVAFEADQLDPETCTGWSVLVTGTMREIATASGVLRAQQLRLAPWVGGERHHFVRITPGLVSGRRIPRERDDRSSAGARPA